MDDPGKAAPVFASSFPGKPAGLGGGEMMVAAGARTCMEG